MAATNAEPPILVSLYTSKDTDDSNTRGEIIRRGFMAGCAELPDTKWESGNGLDNKVSTMEVYDKTFAFFGYFNSNSKFPPIWQQHGYRSGKCVVFFASDKDDFSYFLSKLDQAIANSMVIIVCEQTCYAEIEMTIFKNVIPVTFSDTAEALLKKEDVQAVLEKIIQLWAAHTYQKSLIQTPFTTIDPQQAIAALNAYIDTPASCQIKFSSLFHKSPSNEQIRTAIDKLKTMLREPETTVLFTHAEVESIRSDPALFAILQTHHLLGYLNHVEEPTSTAKPSCSLQ